jgi:transcriptional regulator with XRE-family HTH domain
MNMAKRPVPKYNFKPFGDAIKAARNGRKESRNKVGDEMYLSPRYLANIENKGQHPSLQIFFELVSRYHISVDQFLFEDHADGKTTARRQLDTLLNGLKTLVTGTMNREEALMNVVRHPLLQGRPFILETPNEDVVKLL